jgi:hypothetical protein
MLFSFSPYPQVVLLPYGRKYASTEALYAAFFHPVLKGFLAVLAGTFPPASMALEHVLSLLLSSALPVRAEAMQDG